MELEWLNDRATTQQWSPMVRTPKLHLSFLPLAFFIVRSMDLKAQLVLVLRSTASLSPAETA